MTADDRRDLLLRAGPLLLGPDWQRPLARALGPLHPARAREAIDDRLVRRWTTGEREVPEWVEGAIVLLARSRLDALAGDQTMLQRLISEVQRRA